MEYLEEKYRTDEGNRCLLGNNMEERAQVRDLVGVINDVTFWSGVVIRHEQESSLKWSGMTRQQQKHEAADDGKVQMRKALSKLEGWVEGAVVGRWSVGMMCGETPTVADFSLAALKSYLEGMYGWDILEGYNDKVLGVWLGGFSGSGWFVGRKELERCERKGFEGLFSGG